MLQRYMESLNSRPERREEIQDRLRDLDKLGKMMGKGIRTATSMCEIADELRDKLDAAATSEDEKEGNEEKLRSARAKAASLALEFFTFFFALPPFFIIETGWFPFRFLTVLIVSPIRQIFLTHL